MRAAASSLTALCAASFLALVATCSSEGQQDPNPKPDAEKDAGVGPGDGGDADAPGDEPKPPTACELLGLPERKFSEGPYGRHRHELADDFTIDLVDGTAWNFREQYTGCETYAFVPDTLKVSGLDATSVWEKDLGDLLAKSPNNVHYFFVSRKAEAPAKVSTDAMAVRIAEELAKLPAEAAEHWKSRLHVAAKRSAELGNWVSNVLKGHGRGGFMIGRAQEVRGMGSFADVTRFKSALDQAGQWPWEANLAYAAHEALYLNAEAERVAKLDESGATVIPFWNGEVVSQFAEMDIELPPAAEMATFDTMEVEIGMECPDPEETEFGNCGAWDYLAWLYVKGEDGKNIELARFITSYHRETHWVIDASPMLVHLLKGGNRHFRWEWAPEWNTQPTGTTVKLHLSNKNKGYKPAEATFLWSGGGFDAQYDTLHAPVDVPIPADAKRVELFATVTGHGSGTGQCAEFCNHQHEISVNGTPHLKEFKEAAKKDLCMPQMTNGMVPNQGGTWWTGRGGWCPGQQVDPWVVDVTAEATPGQTATITYKGMYKNKTPPAGAGDISLTSYLVVYR